MKKLLTLSGSFILLAISFQSHAGDVAAGQAKSATCAACHGAGGISSNPLWPNLAGQKAPYLQKQLSAFASGARTDPLMDGVAKALSDEDIANLAAYYESLGK